LKDESGELKDQDYLTGGMAMRLAFALVLLSGIGLLADDDTPPIIPKEPEPRFGVQAKIKVYPQTTAKKALASAIEACDKGDYAYLIAHLLDPGFVELRVTDRAKQFEAALEIELTRLRDYQYANPDRFKIEDRLPLEKREFQAVLLERGRDRAFKQLVRDVEQKLRDDPQALMDMKKILRAGTFTDEVAGAKATNPTVKDSAIYFKKIGQRWFLENRQADETKKEP
jgi:hypothetical protein